MHQAIPAASTGCFGRKPTGPISLKLGFNIKSNCCLSGSNTVNTAEDNRKRDLTVYDNNEFSIKNKLRNKLEPHVKHSIKKNDEYIIYGLKPDGETSIEYEYIQKRTRTDPSKKNTDPTDKKTSIEKETTDCVREEAVVPIESRRKKLC